MKLNETAIKTLNLLCQPYEKHALSKAKVFEWHKKFSEVRTNVEDDKRHDSPVTTKRQKQIKDKNSCENRFLFRYQNDSRSCICRQTNFSNKSKHEKGCACVEMVPRNLNEDQKLARRQVCSEIPDRNKDTNFLKTVATCN
jgi:neutral trehalase